MSFSSFSFCIFFIALFVSFYSIPVKYRIKYLSISSVAFLFITDGSLGLYTLIIAFVNYYGGLLVEKQQGNLKRKIYFLLQIINIGGLIAFKYIDWIVQNISYLIGVDYQFDNLSFKLIVPIGISYYTFQNISYQYLIYKTKDKAEKDVFHYVLYSLFFPKFVAGPIERHRSFLPQLTSNIVFDYDRIIKGGRLFMWGLFKKVVIADTLMIVLNSVYEDVHFFKGIPLIITLLIQPMQIYADFSGYTDMALGLGLIFGINLTNNFRNPFFAKSVGDFWRRWHISLSSWCNDFIYNRLLLKYRKLGKLAVYFSIFASFMIIGIWHGASWNFVMVGFIQFVVLSYEFLFRKWRRKWSNKLNTSILLVLNFVIIYLYVGSFHVFFYSNDIIDSFYVFKNLFSINNISNLSFGFDVNKGEFVIAVISSIVVLWFDYLNEKGMDIMLWFNGKSKVYRWFVYVLWVYFVVYFSKNQNHFVYMDF